MNALMSSRFGMEGVGACVYSLANSEGAAADVKGNRDC